MDDSPISTELWSVHGFSGCRPSITKSAEKKERKMEGDRRWKARIGGARSEPDGSEPRERERERN